MSDKSEKQKIKELSEMLETATAALKTLTEKQPVQCLSGYSIIRCQGAGVFLAQIVSRSGTEAKLKDSRRLWYWSGSASLSELAVSGTSKPTECKFPIAVPEQEVTGVLEVISVSDKAKASIDGVPVWTAQK